MSLPISSKHWLLPSNTTVSSLGLIFILTLLSNQRLPQFPRPITGCVPGRWAVGKWQNSGSNCQKANIVQHSLFASPTKKHFLKPFSFFSTRRTRKKKNRIKSHNKHVSSFHLQKVRSSVWLRAGKWTLSYLYSGCVDIWKIVYLLCLDVNSNLWISGFKKITAKCYI